MRTRVNARKAVASPIVKLTPPRLPVPPTEVQSKMQTRTTGSKRKTTAVSEACPVYSSSSKKQNVGADVNVNVGKNKGKGSTQTLNYRANIGTIIKLLRSLKLNNEHFFEMKKTPFWALYESLLLPTLQSAWCRCYNSNVVDLVRLYQRRQNAFLIGGNCVKLRNSDVRLIFGIDGGTEPISSKVFSRTADMDIEFYKRRCAHAGLNRLDYPALCTMLDNAMKGDTTVDYEDVARIITLILLLKLFIPTTGHSIGWNYLRCVDDLSNMKKYDWVTLIRETLMDSIKKSNNDPRKVSGCVMVLLYWLCEHTNIVRPVNRDAFPRFARWNLGNLFKKLNQSSINDCGKVKQSGLEPTPDEIRLLNLKIQQDRLKEGKELGLKIVAQRVKALELREDSGKSNGSTDDFVEENLAYYIQGYRGVVSTEDNDGDEEANSGDVYNVDEGNDDDGVSHGECRTKTNSGDNKGRGTGKDDGKVKDGDSGCILEKGMNIHSSGDPSSPHDYSSPPPVADYMEHVVASLQTQVKEKDDLIAELKDQIQMMEKKSEEANNEKETEIRALEEKHREEMKMKEAELREIEGRHKEEIRRKEEEYKAQIRREKETLENMNSSMEIHVAEAVEKAFMVATTKPLHAKPIKMLPPPSPEQPPSRIKRIKAKERCRTDKPDFVYGHRVRNNKPRQTRATKEPQQEDEHAVVNVDDYVEKPVVPKRLSFPKSAKVWHVLDKSIQDKIKLINKKAPGEPVWSGRTEQTAIYLTDILRLCRNDDLIGNVIDAWAEMHSAQQMTIDDFEANTNGCVENPLSGLSYCFPTIWQIGFDGKNEQLKKTLVDDHLELALKHRYIHFPINLNSHWTIVVFDNECGEWRHYNSMLPRGVVRDPHVKIAEGLMEYVNNFQRQRMREDLKRNPQSVLTTQDITTHVTSVVPCPQQLACSNDCAIAVCNVIRQHFEWKPVQDDLTEDEWTGLRAMLVIKYLTDPIRSWKESEYDMLQKALPNVQNGIGKK